MPSVISPRARKRVLEVFERVTAQPGGDSRVPQSLPRRLAAQISEGARMVGERAVTLANNLHWFIRVRRAERTHSWDEHMGTDTGGVVTQAGLGIDRETRQHASEYMASLPSTFAEIVAVLPAERGAYTFMDLGAGKGRVLLMAAGAGFGAVIGVEISAALCDLARDNIAHCRLSEPQRKRLTVRCGDAGQIQVPVGPLVVYLFRPFDEVVLKRALRKVVAAGDATQAPIFVAYVRPTPASIDCFKDSFRVVAQAPNRSVLPWVVFALGHDHRTSEACPTGHVPVA